MDDDEESEEESEDKSDEDDDDDDSGGNSLRQRLFKNLFILNIAYVGRILKHCLHMTFLGKTMFPTVESFGLTTHPDTVQTRCKLWIFPV